MNKNRRRQIENLTKITIKVQLLVTFTKSDFPQK